MSPTVLVVDDSQTVRKVVEMALKASPFQVVGVGSARDGIQAAERAPAVILLDYHMPDASGYEVCRALKQNAATAHIPVVMLGGNARPFSEADARHAGAVDVVMKPFMTDTLLSAIQRAASSAEAAPAPGPPAPGPTAAGPPPRKPLAEPQPRPAVAQARTPGIAAPSRTGGSQPRIATPDVNASSRAHELAQAPAQPAATTTDSGVSNIGMSRAEIEALVKTEVQRAVKEQLPSLLRNVMGEVFQQKVLPKLIDHSEQRVNMVVDRQLNEKIAQVVRMEIERLLAEE